MATPVLIPKLGMTMTEGTVAEWLVPDGGEVAKGAIVYRLETEKIQFEVEAESEGTVRHLVPEGAKLPPGDVVAYILAPGEALPAGVAAAATATTAPAVAGGVAISQNGASTLIRQDSGRAVATPIARRLAKERGLSLDAIVGTGPGGRIVEADVLTARARPATSSSPAASPAGGEVLASPLARRLADALGIDLRRVTGSGPGGRITKEDVDQFAAAPALAPATQRPPSAAAAGQAGASAASSVIPLRGMRKVIADRMHGSLQEMAQLTMSIEVEMDEAEKLRRQLLDEWAEEGVRPSFTDLVLRAVAKALPRHPRLNATVTERGIELLSEVHVGMAVALDDGLVVPVIRDAGRVTLKELAAESTRLAEAARAGKLLPDDYAGPTFSVTPLGMFGIDFFTPIINPPNVAILGVGRIHDGLTWDGDRPLRRRQMTLSLTIDHRAVDGAPAAQFLGTVRDLLQAPYRLLV